MSRDHGNSRAGKYNMVRLHSERNTQSDAVRSVRIRKLWAAAGDLDES